MKTLNKKIGLIILFLLYLYIISSFTSYEQMALYIIVPLAFVLSLLIRPKRTNIYITLLFILYLWVSITYFVATYLNLAQQQLHQIWGCFLFAFPIFCISCRYFKNILWVYGLWLMYYLVCIFQLRDLEIMSFSMEDRVSEENGGFNANHFGQFTVFLTFILYLYGEYNRKFHFLFWLILPISFYIALLTASRQVLILQIPYISVLIYLRYFKFGRVRSRYLMALAFIIIIPLLFSSVEKTYENSYLAQRNEQEVESDARVVLLKNAIEVGLKHPLVGVGPGNFRKYSYNSYSYSHNTFAELFANTGFLGFLLYFSMVAIFLRRQYFRYRSTHDPMYMNFFIFGIFYAIDNFFISFYTSILLVGFFILVSTHAELYYEEYHHHKNIL